MSGLAAFRRHQRCCRQLLRSRSPDNANGSRKAADARPEPCKDCRILTNKTDAIDHLLKCRYIGLIMGRRAG